MLADRWRGQAQAAHWHGSRSAPSSVLRRHMLRRHMLRCRLLRRRLLRRRMLRRRFLHVVESVRLGRLPLLRFQYSRLPSQPRGPATGCPAATCCGPASTRRRASSPSRPRGLSPWCCPCGVRGTSWRPTCTRWLPSSSGWDPAPWRRWSPPPAALRPGPPTTWWQARRAGSQIDPAGGRVLQQR